MMKGQRRHGFEEGDRWRLNVETRSQKVLEEYIKVGVWKEGRGLGSSGVFGPAAMRFCRLLLSEEPVTWQTREL